MAAFFENTWLFWWILAAIAVLRWLHTNSSEENWHLSAANQTPPAALEENSASKQHPLNAA